MYKLDLDMPRLKLYITGLNSSVQLIANNLMQGNTALALKQSIEQLNNIHKEFMLIDAMVDEEDKRLKQEQSEGEKK